MFEEHIRCTLGELEAKLRATPPRGELTLCVQGCSPSDQERIRLLSLIEDKDSIDAEEDGGETDEEDDSEISSRSTNAEDRGRSSPDVPFTPGGFDSGEVNREALIEQLIRQGLANGKTVKKISQEVSKGSGVGRNLVYDLALRLAKEK